jgi:hypothetical protein
MVQGSALRWAASSASPPPAGRCHPQSARTCDREGRAPRHHAFPQAALDDCHRPVRPAPPCCSRRRPPPRCLRATLAWGRLSAPSPGARPSRWSSRSGPTIGSRNRSGWRPTTSCPRRSPTRPSTRTPPTFVSRSRSTMTDCACRSSTTAWAGPILREGPVVLGLSDRVHALGGSMEVDSRLGRGTTIVAQLPLRTAATTS